MRKDQPSFTLIELLIVIGILATLATLVIIVLNPVEYFKEARDTKRVSELKALDSSLRIAEAQGVSLGSASIVSISVPDTSPTCANLSLPPLPAGWTYGCVTSENLTNINGTGWIPVDLTSLPIQSPLSRLPIDPVNSVESGEFYSYAPGGSFHLRAIVESEKYLLNAEQDGGSSDNGFETGSNKTLLPSVFPNNWILVPGNSTYGTSDFWVMKYEAKYDKNLDGVGDESVAANCPSGSNGLDWRDAGCSDASKVVTGPDGSPIVRINHDQAVSACVAIGAHLITNDEWMTIARNIEQVSANWSSGSVGSGSILAGNIGLDTASINYNSTVDPDRGTNRNATAKHTLSNGNTIYDISGNAFEHVRLDAIDTLIADIDLPDTASGANAFATRAYTAITSYGALSYDDLRASNSSWTTSHRTGNISTCDQCTGSTLRVVARGGYYSWSTNAGIYSAYFNFINTSTADYLGFRCAR